MYLHASLVYYARGLVVRVPLKNDEISAHRNVAGFLFGYLCKKWICLPLRPSPLSRFGLLAKSVEISASGNFAGPIYFSFSWAGGSTQRTQRRTAFLFAGVCFGGAYTYMLRLCTLHGVSQFRCRPWRPAPVASRARAAQDHVGVAFEVEQHEQGAEEEPLPSFVYVFCTGSRNSGVHILCEGSLCVFGRA